MTIMPHRSPVSKQHDGGGRLSVQPTPCNVGPCVASISWLKRCATRHRRRAEVGQAIGQDTSPHQRAVHALEGWEKSRPAEGSSLLAAQPGCVPGLRREATFLVLFAYYRAASETDRLTFPGVFGRHLHSMRHP